jgi:hypothetical protein
VVIKQLLNAARPEERRAQKKEPLLRSVGKGEWLSEGAMSRFDVFQPRQLRQPRNVASRNQIQQIKGRILVGSSLKNEQPAARTTYLRAEKGPDRLLRPP